jgi:MYXO-CTERM domain-containing protein
MLRARHSKSIKLALFTVLACLANPVSADLPPPDGQKFVGFSFRVENSKAFPDWVLVAYPCSASYGVPSLEAQVVSDGTAVNVGRRGGQPELYRMKRTDYETSKALFVPGPPGNDTKPLEALFTGDKVVKCSGAKPSPSFVLPKTDPRSAIVQTLRVEKIDGKGCAIAAVAETTPSPTPNPTPSAAATSDAGANDPPAAISRRKSGCGGCATPGGGEPDSGLLALGLIALGWLRRRRTSR